MRKGERMARAVGQRSDPARAHAPAVLDRRELLRAVTALAVLFGLPDVAPARERAFDADDFRDITTALTGFTPRDAALSDTFFEAFRSEIDDLAKLHALIDKVPEDQWDQAIAQAGLAPLAEALITAWYTGMVGQGSEQRVLTYLDAFVWYAVGYTKPPTQCDANFGTWADEPSPGRFPG